MWEKSGKNKNFNIGQILRHLNQNIDKNAACKK
jgi:hypothetical protein